MANIAVIGAGAWGTALASLWANSGHDVMIWARSADLLNSINRDHQNPRYLPGSELASGLSASNSLLEVLEKRSIVVLAIPTQALIGVLSDLQTFLNSPVDVVLVAKGIDQRTKQLPHQLLAHHLPDASGFVLSGPSFAADVVAGLPTAVSFAGHNEARLLALREQLGSPSFRLYTTSDVVGVEIGGALKNVLAIACGISDGLGMGASAKAALIARGFAEIKRFAGAFGAVPDTLFGLSGLGDIVLTCQSPQSRNMAFGIRLGNGMTVDDAIAASTGVCEGATTAPVVSRIAKEQGIDMPILEQITRIISGAISPANALTELLSRPMRNEQDEDKTQDVRDPDLFKRITQTIGT